MACGSSALAFRDDGNVAQGGMRFLQADAMKVRAQYLDSFPPQLLVGTSSNMCTNELS